LPEREGPGGAEHGDSDAPLAKTEVSGLSHFRLRRRWLILLTAFLFSADMGRAFFLGNDSFFGARLIATP
jgi:hypothetical protein